jgi:cyclopropane fatty-acyl-phospholipid synthase-like methyltransferase
MAWVEGDALRGETYPKSDGFDLIISTGLGEFLDDEQLAGFYGNVFSALKDGGVFFTSATAFERRSHFLMKTFELNAHYRSSAQVRTVLKALPWKKLEIESDPTGLQTFIRAAK